MAMELYVEAGLLPVVAVVLIDHALSLLGKSRHRWVTPPLIKIAVFIIFATFKKKKKKRLKVIKLSMAKKMKWHPVFTVIIKAMRELVSNNHADGAVT